MMETFNVVVYVNGVETQGIEFTSTSIQNFRIYGGVNEIQDTRLRYWTVDEFETTYNGLVLYLSK